ncbi:MAG TPA: hypothetical protein VIY48_09640 [Candidatus Paceibacterota bacterium]
MKITLRARLLRMSWQFAPVLNITPSRASKTRAICTTAKGTGGTPTSRADSGEGPPITAQQNSISHCIVIYAVVDSAFGAVYSGREYRRQEEHMDVGKVVTTQTELDAERVIWVSSVWTLWGRWREFRTVVWRAEPVTALKHIRRVQKYAERQQNAAAIKARFEGERLEQVPSVVRLSPLIRDIA